MIKSLKFACLQGESPIDSSPESSRRPSMQEVSFNLTALVMLTFVKYESDSRNSVVTCRLLVSSSGRSRSFAFGLSDYEAS